MLVKGYVASDPHSFVFQYVLKAKPTSDSESLLEWNLMQLKSSPSKSTGAVIRRLRLTAIKNILFPFGSARHRVAKKVFSKLTG